MRRSTAIRDGGFTLMEVIVAMTLFTALVSAALGVLLRTTHAVGGNTRRVTAASLVNRQIESVRSMRAIDIPDGGSIRTETVGGTTYTIRQTASYVPNEATTSVCTATGNVLAYKLITVKVTWPNMGSIKPVRADTLRSVGLGANGLDATKGTVALTVVDAAGAPATGTVVTLSPGGSSVNTGDDGCAVFVGLNPGNYTASMDTAGHVGVANTRLVTMSGIGVTAGQVTRGELVYDTERRVELLPGGPEGYLLPAGVQVLLRDAYVQAGVLPPCSGTPQGCLTQIRE